jgi:cytochrome c oxidase subunit IV
MAIAKTNPTKTILTITIGFLIVYIITDLNWALLVALFVGLAGLLSSFIAQKIDFLWMKLAWVLSLIVPNILLSLIFFAFLFPIALLSKLFGKKDPLILKNTRDSLFITSNKTFDKSSFEKPW